MIKKASSRWHLDKIWKEGEMGGQGLHSRGILCSLKVGTQRLGTTGSKSPGDVCNEGTRISGAGGEWGEKCDHST